MDSQTSSFEAIDDPIYPFGPEIVKMEVRAVGNDFSTSFPLKISITFGDFERERQSNSILGIKKRNYRISVQYCKFIYVLDCCQIHEDTKYRQPIQIGTFSEEALVKVREERSGGASIEIAGGFDTLKPTGLSKFLRIFLKGKVAGDNEKTKIINYKTKLNLIEPIPNGWAIGIEGIGDPSRESTKYCLRSIYFDEVNDKYHSSCIVNFQNGANECTLNFAVRLVADSSSNE